MAKTFFIVNPIAGGGKAGELVPIIRQAMAEVEIQYDLAITRGPGDAVDIAKRGLGAGYEVLVAVGGDGTINEVARGILEADRGRLGILPSGTGNDLARSLGIDLDPIKAIDTIVNGTVRYIDVGFVNDRIFLNIASIGFDAETVMNTEKIKKRIRSNIAYVIGVIITLLGFKDKRVELDIDGIKIDGKITLIAIGNGRYYGGGLKILPMAIPDDGYFYICIVNRIARLKLLFLFPTIFKGRHIEIRKYVEVYRAKTVRVKTIDEAYLNIDGEVYDIEGETLFTMNDKKLPIITN
ncbi:MAG: diacylglycerol kinase family lipid kinase [Tissierellia bacterium]|nr:diacylglycerol kinase family lipid kinase [Tissierellia bacterium]